MPQVDTYEKNYHGCYIYYSSNWQNYSSYPPLEFQCVQSHTVSRNLMPPWNDRRNKEYKWYFLFSKTFQGGLELRDTHEVVRSRYEPKSALWNKNRVRIASFYIFVTPLWVSTTIMIYHTNIGLCKKKKCSTDTHFTERGFNSFGIIFL